MEKCIFSTVTQKYLDSYAGILDTMTGTMNCAKENDSISYNFIVKMIPHHQGAIRISEELLRYTTCIALQNIATEIVVPSSAVLFFAFLRSPVTIGTMAVRHYCYEYVQPYEVGLPR